MKRGNFVLPRSGWDGPSVAGGHFENQSVKKAIAAAPRLSTRPRMPANFKALPMESLGFDFF